MLDILVGVGKWLMMGFLVQQERRIQVIVNDYHGWSSKTVVTLDEADEKEVDEWPKAKKAKGSLKQTAAR